MAVTYRAIWQEDRPELVDAAIDAFRGWATGKHGCLTFDDEGVGGECVSSDGRRVWATQLEATEESGRALELILREDSETDRWITTVRVAVEDEEQWVWVDVEHNAEDPWAPRPQIAAPKLVSTLLEESILASGDPRWGVIRLSGKAMVVRPEEVAEKAVNRIRSPHRRSPEVVFAHSYKGGAAETMERAKRAAARLAGAASVLVLPEDAVGPFNEGIGTEDGLEFGQVRLYLPGEVPPHRNRVLASGFVARHASATAIQLGLFLQPAMANRRPPPPLDRALGRLRRGRGSAEGDLLVVAEQEVEVARRAVASKDHELEQARSEHDDLVFELMDRDEKIGTLQRVIDSYRLGAGEISKAEMAIPREVLSITEALELARLHLDGLSIPEGVGRDRDLEELDQTTTATAWGNTTWRGLRALHAYAMEAGSVDGGFREWCKQGGPDAWPATSKKFAPVESESVRNNELWWACRLLPVSVAVDPSGQIHMESHLKIAEGGGDQAPRVYFFDDTKGATGKVHVGFVGPHRHMRNKNTN